MPPTQTPAEADANLLVIEIGNSHIALAHVVDREVRRVERMLLSEMDELQSALSPAWEALPGQRRRAVAIASVVPRTLERVQAIVEREIGDGARVVGEQIRLPLSLVHEDPHGVGVDRVCSAAAAYEQCGRACAVASFGTATTIDCVNEQGVFLGGAILPGLSMQAAALHEGTAALPVISIHAPHSVYGTTTVDAINNGVVYGSIGALREIVERYATDLRKWPPLIVTGGFGQLVADACDFVDAVEPDLCIRGIALAYRRHFDPLGDE